MSIQTKTIESHGELFEHQFLCHYRPWSVGFDKLSKSLLRFKNNEFPDVKAWIECSMEALAEFLAHTTIIRALNHEELTAHNAISNPLDKLGIALGEKFDCTYSPQLLVKKRFSRPQKSLSRKERELETKDLYEFSWTSNPIQILIIDDIITTGQTMSSIIQSIRTSDKTIPIRLFTLASTDRSDNMNHAVHLRGSTYEWQSVEGWTTVNENNINYGASLSDLKRLIHTNFDQSLH